MVNSKEKYANQNQSWVSVVSVSVLFVRGTDNRKKNIVLYI
jgi:hypothetical protein